MPTAPTLSRPPRLDSASSSFATPPTSFDRPASGNNTQLRDAAVNTSVRSARSSLTPESGALARDPDVARAPRPRVPTSTGPTRSSFGPPSETVSRPSTPPTGNTNYGYGNPTAARTLDPSSGAPPGTPDTSQYTVPLLPQDEASIANANRAYSDAEAAANYGMGQAAFAYGDPTQMARFGVGTVNPNSALALAALKAQQQQEASTLSRGRAGTVNSSLALEDASRISSGQQRADLAANVKYQQALARFNQTLVAAQAARDSAINSAQADERAAALQNLPTANTASGGFPSSTATGSKSIATRGGTGGTKTGAAPRGARGTKPAKNPSVPKVGKGRAASKSSSTVRSPGKVSVRKPPRVGARR